MSEDNEAMKSQIEELLSFIEDLESYNPQTTELVQTINTLKEQVIGIQLKMELENSLVTSDSWIQLYCRKKRRKT